MYYLYLKNKFKKDFNSAFKCILDNDEALNSFFTHSDEFSNIISQFNYEQIKLIINKTKENNLTFNKDFIHSISVENQYRILNELELDNTELVYFIENFSNEVKSYFFTFDLRSRYLYSNFNISKLIKQGIKFNNELLKLPEFFDKLKSTSFVEFRNNINNIEKYNDPNPIEYNLNKFYDELISNYNDNLEIFNEYHDVLNDSQLIYKLNKFAFLFDSGVVEKVEFNINNRVELFNIFKEETSKKLNEIIIDAIFRDNIYNVKINIREMLRYNELLNMDEKILSDNKIKFYESILNIENLNNKQKLDIYNTYKDLNYNLVFYEDLRKLKDISYNNIKKDLTNPMMHPEYIDKTNKDKYRIDVYDLRDKEYLMLVRTELKHKDQVFYRKNSYSIISNYNNTIFGNASSNTFLYGYIDFDINTISHIYENDSYSMGLKEKNIRYPNRVVSTNELINVTSSYNEIQILNKKNPNSKHLYYTKKPDFVIAISNIRQREVEEAKRLNIPIVIINPKRLDKNNIINLSTEEYIYSEKEEFIYNKKLK